MKKIILDLCGGTGSWSKPYLDRGYEIHNITLPEYDILHTQFILDRYPNFLTFYGDKGHDIKIKDVYGILAAPPCTMFSFARTNAKSPRDLQSGMEIVEMCLKIVWACQYQIEKDAQRKPPLEFWALENPNGMLKWFLGKPTFEFSPYDFGDDYQKQTYLWGYFNLPKKNPIELTREQKKLAKTNSQPLSRVKFNMIKSKDICPDMYGKLTWKERRAITPKGFAKAFFDANK